MESSYNYQLGKLYLHRLSMTRRSGMKRVVFTLVSLALFANATADVQMTEEMQQQMKQLMEQMQQQRQ